MELTIQSLADLVDGRLRLAVMPPLGGVDEPIGKLVANPDLVTPGDVLVVSDDLRSQHPLCETEAYDRGALGVVSSGKSIEPWPGRFSVQVNDAPWALWQLASTARSEYEGQVLAVAGSVGKTTSAALMNAVLGLPADSTPSDALGITPLVEQMLALPESRHAAIFELHADSNSDLDSAMHLCRPNIVVAIHPELFDADSAASSISSCRELHAALPDGGSLIVGPASHTMARGLNRDSTIMFGRSGACDISPTHVLCTGKELTFAVDGQVVRLNTVGRHFLDNALAAWAVGRAMGISERNIAARLASVRWPTRRCEFVQAGGITFVDDTACRNQLARRASLAILSSLAGSRRVVVCGGARTSDVYDGDWGNELVEIGGADAVVAVGRESEAILQSAMDAGMPRGQCIRCDACDSVAQKLFNFLSSGDVVLLTGVDAQVADRVLALFQNTLSATTAKAAAA